MIYIILAIILFINIYLLIEIKKIKDDVIESKNNNDISFTNNKSMLINEFCHNRNEINEIKEVINKILGVIYAINKKLLNKKIKQK